MSAYLPTAIIFDGDAHPLPAPVSPERLQLAVDALLRPPSYYTDALSPPEVAAVASAVSTLCDATGGAGPMAYRERAVLILYGAPYEERAHLVAHLGAGAKLTPASRGVIGGLASAAALGACLGAAGVPLLTSALIALRNLSAGTCVLGLKERGLRAAAALPVLDFALASPDAGLAAAAAGMLANLASIRESRLMYDELRRAFGGGLRHAAALACAALGQHAASPGVVSAAASALNNLAGMYVSFGEELHEDAGAPLPPLPATSPEAARATARAVAQALERGGAASSGSQAPLHGAQQAPPLEGGGAAGAGAPLPDWEEEEDFSAGEEAPGARARARTFGAATAAPLLGAMFAHRARMLAGDVASVGALTDAARAYLGTGLKRLPAEATFAPLQAALCEHPTAAMGGAVARALVAMLSFAGPEGEEEEEEDEEGGGGGAAGVEAPPPATCRAFFLSLARALMNAPAEPGASGDVARAVAQSFRAWWEAVGEEKDAPPFPEPVFVALFARLSQAVAGSLARAAGSALAEALPAGFTFEELRSFDAGLLAEVCAAQGLPPAPVPAALAALELTRGLATAGAPPGVTPSAIDAAAACGVCGEGAGPQRGGLLTCDGLCASPAAAHAACAGLPGAPTSAWFCVGCLAAGVAPPGFSLVFANGDSLPVALPPPRSGGGAQRARGGGRDGGGDGGGGDGGGADGGGGDAAPHPHPHRVPSLGEAAPSLLPRLGGPAGAPLLEALTALRRVSRALEENELLPCVERSQVLPAVVAVMSACAPGACGVPVGGPAARTALDELLAAACRAIDGVAGLGSERLTAAVEYAGAVPLLLDTVRGALARGGYPSEGVGGCGAAPAPPAAPRDADALPLPTTSLLFHALQTLGSVVSSASAARSVVAGGGLPLLAAALRVGAPASAAPGGDAAALGSYAAAVRTRAAEALWWIATESPASGAACVAARVQEPLAVLLAREASEVAAGGEDAEVWDDSEAATVAGALNSIAESGAEAAEAVAATGATVHLLALLRASARAPRSRCVMESVARALGAVAASSPARAAEIAAAPGALAALLRILRTCADPRSWETVEGEEEEEGGGGEEEEDEDDASVDSAERREYAERACGGAAAALAALFHAGGAATRARILADTVGAYDPTPTAVAALVAALEAHGDSVEGADMRGALRRMGYRENGEKVPVVVLEHLSAGELAERQAHCLECFLTVPRRACDRAGGPPPCRAPHECAICYDADGGEDTGGWLGLRCGHLFHRNCIMKWAAKELRDGDGGVVRCPVDRRTVSRDRVAGAPAAEETETEVTLEGGAEEDAPAAGGDGGGGAGAE